jgi:hypothetical protein
MNELYRALKLTGKGRRKALILAYILNIVIITFFLMVITGFKDTINESLSPNDYEQIVAILSSTIGISIVTIIFYQWIVITLFKSLYQSRQHFNTNIRLMGVKKIQLFSLYFKEFVSMQTVAIPFGVISGWMFYFLIAAAFNFQSKSVNVFSLWASPIIQFIIMFATIAITFVNLSKQDSLSRKIIRSNNTFTWSNGRIIKTIIGIVILIVTTYLVITIHGSQTFYLLLLCYFIVGTLLFDLIFFLFNRFGYLISILTHSGSLRLSLLLSNGKFSKTRAISYMIIFSVAISVGLQSLWLTLRQAAYDSANNNIYYSAVETTDNLMDISSIKDNNTVYGLYYMAPKLGSNRVRILGVDSGFIINKCETINIDKNLSDLTDQELKKDLDDPNWNGIIFPQSSIQPRNIGTEYKTKLNGIDVTFVIKGGNFPNNIGEFRCLVSRGYLEKVLGQTNKVNTAFHMGNTYKKAFQNSSIQTKMDVVKISHDKSVQSTDLIEVIMYIILICALVMLLNYIYLVSLQDKGDIARMRAFGMSAGKVNFVYLFHFIFIIFISYLIGILFAWILSLSGCNLVMNHIYLGSGIIISWNFVLLLFCVFSVLSIVSFVLFSYRANKKQYLQIIREQNNE